MKELYRFRQFLTESKLYKDDESLDSKLDNLEDVYDPEPQISTAVFNEEGFYLTPSDIDAIKDTAQVEYSEYQNQEKMIGPEADSIIKKFKKEVTPEIWKDWVEYNEGDDRIAHILNLFNEIYAEGEILKEESINEAWINNWFDLLLNGVLIVSALQYSLNKAGLSLKDPKSIIKKVKDGWKYMTNKKVYDIVKKLINDPDILQAAKVELRGPRGGKRKLDNQIAYQQVLKSKLSEEELNILKAFSEDLIKKDFTKDLKARTYRDNGSYPYRKPLKNTYDFKKYKDDTEGEESINEAQKYDMEAVLRDIREFNRGNIDMETLTISTLKNLGYHVNPDSKIQVEDHFRYSMYSAGTERLPMDYTMVRELYDILNSLK